MAKRRNGEGTWGKKIINGQDYYFFRDAEGKYTYGKTQKEIENKIREKSKAKKVNPKKLTFGEYITEWLKGKKSSIEPTTYDCYESLINSGVLNYKIADVQLHNLDDRKFQNYLNELTEKYARGSINKLWSLIKECLKYGMEHEELPKILISYVKVPIESVCTNKTKDIPFLTEEDLDKLYEVKDAAYPTGALIYGNNARFLILTAYTGCRISELVALKWKNYNPEKRTIDIVSSSARIIDRSSDAKKKTKVIDKAPKTKESARTIPLPDRAVEIIEWFGEKNPKHKPNDYICISSLGTKIDTRAANRTLKSMAKRAGLSETNIAPHSLRHTYGSILIRNGVDIKTVSALLGHADISTTYNIYIGILDSDKAKDVNRVFNK